MKVGTSNDTGSLVGSVGLGSTAGGDVSGTLPGNLTVEAVNGMPPSWKNAVRVATTVAGTLATSFEAGDTVDGVVLATGDRILVKDQAGAENGIYIVTPAGVPPARAPDMDEADEVVGAIVFVSEGTANAGTLWITTNTGAPVIDTDAITFAPWSASITAALDDLTDVTITTPALYDRLRFDGTVWRNSNRIWRPLLASDGTIVVASDGQAIMSEGPA